MPQWLLNLQAVTQLFGVAHQALTYAEQIFPNAAHGVQRVDAAVQILSAAIPASGVPNEHVAALQTALPAVVNTVATLKAAADALNSNA